jgi:hypothetical protein
MKTSRNGKFIQTIEVEKGMKILVLPDEIDGRKIRPVIDDIREWLESDNEQDFIIAGRVRLVKKK